jgi:hypothetical protein
MTMTAAMATTPDISTPIILDAVITPHRAAIPEVAILEVATQITRTMAVVTTMTTAATTMKIMAVVTVTEGR